MESYDIIKSYIQSHADESLPKVAQGIRNLEGMSEKIYHDTLLRAVSEEDIPTIKGMLLVTRKSVYEAVEKSVDEQKVNVVEFFMDYETRYDPYLSRLFERELVDLTGIIKVAAMRGNIQILKTLLNNELHKDIPLIIPSACQGGSMEVLRYIIEHSPKNSEEDNERLRVYMNSGMISAIEFDRPEILDHLLENGADGLSRALEAAVFFEREDMLSKLSAHIIKHKKKVSIRSRRLAKLRPIK